jgi:hypothetical protein
MNSNPPTRHRSLWPAGIVAAFVVFIAATLGLIMLSASQRTELVAKDYYEQELRYQEQMDRQARARSLASPARVTYDAARHTIQVALPQTAAQRPVGQIHFYRPASARLDRRLPLNLNEAGKQTVDTRPFAAGLWRVRIRWSVDGQEYAHDQDVVIKPEHL